MLTDNFYCVDQATCSPVTGVIETRIMDISSSFNSGAHLVAAACSDGVIRVKYE